MAFISHLQLFLLLAFLSSNIISAHDLHVRGSAPRLLFPQHLQGSRKGDTLEGIHRVKAYLHRFGYLSQNTTINNGSHADAFDDLLESAVKTYQTFFKLNVSGVLDEKTLGQMSRARCGVSESFFSRSMDDHIGDSHYSFFPRNKKWPVYKMHLTYGFIHNFPIQYENAVVRAFGTWEANTRFSFSLAPRVQTADILLSFERGDHGDGHPFDPAGQVMAHAFGPMDGRVHFNAVVQWSDGYVFEQYDVESAVLHEIGHVLGLGHSAIESAVMWPDMDSGVTKNRLHPDDIAGIRAVYH